MKSINYLITLSAVEIHYLQKFCSYQSISGQRSHFISPWKYQKTWLFGVFSGYKMKALAKNGLDYVWIVKDWLKSNMLENTFKNAGASYSQKLNIAITPKVQSNIWTSAISLSLSWQRSLSYKNQSNDLQSKSWDWFPQNSDFSYERVNGVHKNELTHTNVNKNLLKCLGTLNCIIWKKRS